MLVGEFMANLHLSQDQQPSTAHPSFNDNRTEVLLFVPGAWKHELSVLKFLWSRHPSGPAEGDADDNNLKKSSGVNSSCPSPSEPSDQHVLLKTKQDKQSSSSG